ncbi:MAG TPA: MFS transporter [Abditibacteriaceae bacterium]|nr:MFS transporter [Abditibacteriaceae bacterium]
MNDRAVRLAVLVAALGYFVDIYDLLLFSIVRIKSLGDLGVASTQVKDVGIHLLNVQMFGMLIGGILWGVLGDKRGRSSVLLGSIAMYSVANILNGLVQTVPQYEILRFVAGVGLAGELGAGITLVSEIMGRNERGYGTMVVAGIGVLGAVLAAFVAERFAWRTAYFIGGGLGLSLLMLRVGVLESGMFQKLAHDVPRGNLLMLFNSPGRLVRYLACILVGLPTWFVVGVLITLSPEFGLQMGVAGVSAGSAIMATYSGIAVGDFASGWLSQKLRSRRKVIALFLALTAVLVVMWANARGLSLTQFYTLCFALGVAVGYWALFVVNSAEQFGTNIRATVATTTPNFVRGAVPLLSTSFLMLSSSERFGMMKAALTVGLASVLIAVCALLILRETYGKDLDYVEA